jgi:hopanoid biosynthesis associated radical SAM protein HpnH
MRKSCRRWIVKAARDISADNGAQARAPAVQKNYGAQPPSAVVEKSSRRPDLPVPISQMWTVASYVIKQKLAGRKRYPLTLMLEPLFRCNLACAGCGKIQYPAHILKKELTPEECFRAVEECGAPTVSIPGGEPLMHSQIDEIVEGLVARKKYIYLCTNALLLKEKLDLFKPSKYLTFSVHMDGQRDHHDFSVCREGGYDLAMEGIREALKRGFRVTTNTTLFDGADPNSVRAFFDEMMELGVEGMMLSPGYSYDKAPDQKHFMGRARIRRMFRAILSNRKKSWRFNMSPLFPEFLMGKRDYACTPWGMPTYNLFGWQKPCYLLQDGYADTFKELMAATEWQNYGTESGNPKCANCMVHSGYEASSVDDGFGSLRGFFAMVKASVFSGTYKDEEALQMLNETTRPVHSYNPLVQIAEPAAHLEENTVSTI